MGEEFDFGLIDGIKESFNIKVEKEYVLMRNGTDLVGTEDYLNRLELKFHIRPHCMFTDRRQQRQPNHNTTPYCVY